MPAPLRPHLRPGVRAASIQDQPRLVVWDSHNIVPDSVTAAAKFAPVMHLLDGTRSLQQLAAETGLPVPDICGFAAQLNDALLLDDPAFWHYLAGPDRKPSCLSVYPADPRAVPAALEVLFTAPGGPGLPRPDAPAPPGRLRAVLAPHMDYHRGNITYGQAFRDLIEQTDARLFVLVATSHYSPHRFTLTRKNYSTSLGEIETDQAFVSRLADRCGPSVFADPVAHLPEHSIEIELPFLQQYLPYPVRIVPLLVGSFRDVMERGQTPGASREIATMVEALQAAEAAAGEPVCYLMSGDLAHIGPKFGDPVPVSREPLAASAARDAAVLAHLATANADGYFAEVATEQNCRRICGLAPTWVALSAARPRRGIVRHYQQYVHPEGHESVSFAAASFYD